MKSNSKNIIKKLLLSSLASLIHLAGNANNDPALAVPTLTMGLEGGVDNEYRSALKSKIYKNVLAIKSTGETRYIASHRSHSSHRSHRSHYSSRAGHSSHYSHYSGYSGSGGGTTNSSSSNASSSHSVAAPARTYKDYFLGERTISSGAYGNDVDKLVTLLVEKRYLKHSAVTQKSGYAQVDKAVVAAIKHFQKDAGVAPNGQLTSSLVSTLKSWDAEKTTVSLGFRPIHELIAGYDINELVALLSKVGFPPDPTQLKSNKYGFYYFTEEIAMAVKLFQAYNGLPTTGKPDERTIEKLKSVAQ